MNDHVTPGIFLDEWTAAHMGLRNRDLTYTRRATSRADAANIVRNAGGRDVAVYGGIVMVGPDGTPFTLVARGEEAGELEDIALEYIEKYEQQHVVDFEETRELHGRPSATTFDQNFREALWDRAKAHEKNFRTDPEKKVGKKKE
jgi:hypothetical protein